MFSPFEGMVAEPTEENVTAAKEEKLNISLPWLVDETEAPVPPRSAQSADVHPVTGSNHHLCLFDRFHEGNVKREEEVLRRLDNVEQLKGRLNSQKDEKLHTRYNHDTMQIPQRDEACQPHIYFQE